MSAIRSLAWATLAVFAVIVIVQYRHQGGVSVDLLGLACLYAIAHALEHLGK